MVRNNIKYSYSDYNTIDKVVEITDEIMNRLSPRAKLELKNPVNSENQKDWEIDKRNIIF